MRNTGLDEAQAGIKTAGRTIKTSDMQMTRIMAESKEELKSLLMNVKEESEKVGLKLMASGPTTSWQIDGETGNNGRLYFFGLQNHCRWWLQPRN